MLVVFYFLVMLRVGGCMSEGIFNKRTVVVGDEVKLTCKIEPTGSYYWIRLSSGNFPEYLGKSFNIPNSNSHITTSTDTGVLKLHIKQAQLKDTGLYWCLTASLRNLTFLRGTNLTVKVKPAAPTVPPPGLVPSTDPVHTEKSEEKTCPGEHSVCCYRSHQLFPGFNLSQKIKEENHQNPAGLSVKKCICSFIQNSSASDPGTCLWAVDSYEENPENRSNREDQAGNKYSQTSLLLSAALAVCFIIIACLIYYIRNLKKSSCGYFTADIPLQREGETGSSDQQNQQADEDSLIYSAPTFTKRKTVKAETMDVKAEEKESIYAHVMVKEKN